MIVNQQQRIQQVQAQLLKDESIKVTMRTIDVRVINNQPKSSHLFKDIKVFFDQNNQFNLFEVLQQTKLDKYQGIISILEPSADIETNIPLYRFVCNLPPAQGVSLMLEESLVQNNMIYLKFQPRELSVYTQLIGQVKATEDESDSQEKGGNRGRERRIKEVLMKVAVWRRLYTGLKDGNEFVQKSLEDSALEVGVSKKTLDDYLLQIRVGKRYGFDFNANKDEKIGRLRAFVKQHRQKKK